MGENKFRIEPKNHRGNEARVKSSAPGASMFAGIERKLKLDTYFEEGFPVKYLPKILFAVFLSLVYISNTHYAEKTTRQINKAQTEVEDLRPESRCDVCQQTK